MFAFLHHSFITESFTEYIGANLDFIISSQQRNDKKPNLSLQNSKILDSKWNLPILTKWLVKRLVDTGWRNPQSSSCNCFLSWNVRFSLPLWAGNSYLWWTYISCLNLNRLNDEFLRHRSQVHVVYMFLKSCKPSSLLIVFMKVLIRNCLSLVIAFRYAKLYQKTLAELMVEETKYCTSILSRYFWVSVFLLLRAQQHARRKYTSGI